MMETPSLEKDAMTTVELRKDFSVLEVQPLLQMCAMRNVETEGTLGSNSVMMATSMLEMAVMETALLRLAGHVWAVRLEAFNPLQTFALKSVEMDSLSFGTLVMMEVSSMEMDALRTASLSLAGTVKDRAKDLASRSVEMELTWESLSVMIGTSLMETAAAPNA
jgi:hypothetical protein